MASQLSISILLVAVLFLKNSFPITATPLVSYGNPEAGETGDDLIEGSLKSEDYIPSLLPLRKSEQILSLRSSGGVGHRTFYKDPAFIPYIHPRYVYEEDFPLQRDLLPPTSKRATKGMLVDVVDFVTKGAGGRNQRLGQDMRSSGRR